jgi:nitrogen fixation/metabolism regulation signal transduction histidine kinase
VPITHEGSVVAALGVEASAEYFDLLTNFASVLTVLAILAVFLVVLAGTVFSRRLVRPINQLVGAAQRLGKGEWEDPVDVRAEGDEIAFLAGAFEEMRRDIVSRDRQMQMMLSGIAHEVRNPLGGMELFCGLLAEDLESSEFEGEQTEMLLKVNKIQRELDYLERVVTDFLDFARDIPPDLERFAATELLDDLGDLLDAEIGNAGCAIETEVEPEHLEMTADRQKLRRALINVVRNAYQACGEGGRIRIVARADGPARRIIEVVDNGPGISDEKVEEVLTPFYTTKEKGSGLGLALTQRIVEQHGGSLEIDSNEEEGTTVRFVLRFDPDVEKAAPEVPEGWLG